MVIVMHMPTVRCLAVSRRLRAMRGSKWCGWCAHPVVRKIVCAVARETEITSVDWVKAEADKLHQTHDVLAPAFSSLWTSLNAVAWFGVRPHLRQIICDISANSSESGFPLHSLEMRTSSGASSSPVRKPTAGLTPAEPPGARQEQNIKHGQQSTVIRESQDRYVSAL